jgi:hypothetical protein
MNGREEGKLLQILTFRERIGYKKKKDLKRNTFKILFSEVWAYISIIILLQILPGKSCLLPTTG